MATDRHGEIQIKSPDWSMRMGPYHTPSLFSDWPMRMSTCFCLNEPITMVKFNDKSTKLQITHNTQHTTHPPTDNPSPKPALFGGQKVLMSNMALAGPC